MANKISNGKITQVTGAVVDVQFDGDLPEILNALRQFGQEKYLQEVSYCLIKLIS